MEAKNAEPITPHTDGENVKALVDFKSPLSRASSPPRTDEAAGSALSPRTPEEDFFDPFAPGPEELMLAPRCKKYLEESHKTMARRLNFDSFIEPKGARKVDEGLDSVKSLAQEQIFLETVYESILEAIVSKQVERVTAETFPLHADFDGLRTPELSPRLNGVAETCPVAPLKPTKKLRNIGSGLCRKLEF